MRVCVESTAISFVTDINTTVNGTRQTTNANCTKAMPETVFFFFFYRVIFSGITSPFGCPRSMCPCI